jgi:hypothetical protein
MSSEREQAMWGDDEVEGHQFGSQANEDAAEDDDVEAHVRAGKDLNANEDAADDE